MASLTRKPLSHPEEARSFHRGKMELVKVGGVVFARGTLEPGWRWSESIKPIVKTDSCQMHHTGYVVSGRIRIRMDSGEEQEYGPGDTYDIPPGHDAWVVGDEVYIGVDVSPEMVNYAKPS